MRAMYFYDATENGWTVFNIGGPSITKVFGGGDVPFGIDNGGKVYALVPQSVASASPGAPSLQLGPRESAAASLPPAPSYSAWMTALRQQSANFGSLTLGQICIPGSHDSGCYSFSFFQGLTNFPRVLQTQGLDIAGQLNAGARFFDLRPQLYHGWLGGAYYYIHHTEYLTNVLLSEAIQAISTFAVNNPGEIIVVYVNHIRQAATTENNTSLATATLGNLQRALGTVYPLNSITYDQMMQLGQNVILLTDKQNMVPYGFHPNGYVANIRKYADTNWVDAWGIFSDLVTFINKSLAAAQSGKLWMLQCQLTPSAGGSIATVLGTYPGFRGAGPMALAESSITTVQDLLNPSQNSTAASTLNLFIVDDYGTTWTDLAWNINLTRL